MNSEYEESLKTTTAKYHELMAERNLLENTVNRLKEENNRLKNRGARVNKEMF